MRKKIKNWSCCEHYCLHCFEVWHAGDFGAGSSCVISLVIPVLFNNVKPLGDTSRQIPCYFPLSRFIFFSFYHCSAEMLKTNLHQTALLCHYLWKITNPYRVRRQNGGCLAVSKQVVCWTPLGQLWSETPDRPLVPFSKWPEAPRVDSFWKEHPWWLHATSHAAQEALSPHQGSLSTYLMLLPCTKLQTTNPTGIHPQGPDYLSSGITLPRHAKYQYKIYIQAKYLHELFWSTKPLLWNQIPAGIDVTTLPRTFRFLLQSLHWNSNLIHYVPGNIINNSKKITFNLQRQCGNIYPTKLLSFIILVGCNSSKT